MKNLVISTEQGNRTPLNRAAPINQIPISMGAPPAREAPSQKAQTPDHQPDVNFVPTPPEAVDKMLEMAQVKPGDVVYDLGCGDGRIVVAAAKKYGVKAVGIDIDPQRIKESKENVQAHHVENLVTIKQADIFAEDFSEATVVTLYLLPSLNVKLIPQLEKLKPDTRIVSYRFEIEPRSVNKPNSYQYQCSKNSVISTRKSNRRTFLKTAGAAGAAWAAAPALLEQARAGVGQAAEQVIYSHGLVWNTALPGIAGQLLITFDVRAVIGDTGFGTLSDAVHPAINSHVAFDSATRQANVFTLQGSVIRSNDATNIGMAVMVVAEVLGDWTFAHVQVGDLNFMGNGLLTKAFALS